MLGCVGSPKLFGFLRFEDLAVVALAPWLVAGCLAARRRTAAWSGCERCYLLLLIIAATATLISFLTGSNGRGLAAALSLGKLAEYALLYAAVRLSRPAPAAVGLAAAAAVVILAALGLYQAFDGYVLAGEPFVRAFNDGWFAGESNHVAGAVAILSLLAPVTLPLALLAVVASGSRVALAALIASALRLAWGERRYRPLVAAAATLILVAVVTPAEYFFRFAELLPAPAAYAGPHVDRGAAWRVALAEAPPLTGVGLGARPSAVYESNYVLLLAETGLPGLIAFALLLVSLFRRSGDDPPAERRAALAVALAVLALGMNVSLIVRIAGTAAVALATFKAGSCQAENESATEARRTQR